MTVRRHYLTQKEIFAIHNFLKTVLVPVYDGTDHVAYIDNWSDKRVADRFGNGTTSTNVRKIRCDMFGKLRDFRKEPGKRSVETLQSTDPNSNLALAIDKLHRRLQQVEEYLTRNEAPWRTRT